MDSLELFSYYKFDGSGVYDVLAKERICSSCICKHLLLLGTANGIVYVMTVDGEVVKSFCIFGDNSEVNCIRYDSINSAVLACSDNCSVVISSLANLETSGEVTEILHVQFNEPVKFVSLDNNGFCDSSFIAGTSSGKVIHHHIQWMSQKNTTLFNGSALPVTNIVWRGSTLVWADTEQVRLLDMSTRSAICCINCPVIDRDLPLPCTFLWASEADLYIGWADTFTHIELSPAVKAPQAGFATARVVAEWQTDCIICGLLLYDSRRLLLVGCSPSDIGEGALGVSSGDAADGGSPTRAPLRSSVIDFDLVQVQVCCVADGAVVYCDYMSLDESGDERDVVSNPWSYSLLSTFNHPLTCRENYTNVSLKHSAGAFLLCPSNRDFVAIKLQSADDKIDQALRKGNVALAVHIAEQERDVLSFYRYDEVVTLFLNTLVAQGKVPSAVDECRRLIGDDEMLWEKFIYSSLRSDFLPHIVDIIPTTNPRLHRNVYEAVVEMLLHSQTKCIVSVADSWATVDPPLLDTQELLSRLEVLDYLGSHIVEARAKLLVHLRRYDEAVACFLRIRYSLSDSSEPDPETVGTSTAEVFELIEAHELFETVLDNIINCILLSKKRAADLFVRCFDRLPVSAVVARLSQNRPLLHWYLHTIFTRLPDRYNAQEYADYHILQVSLYGEFAPKADYSGSGNSSSGVEKSLLTTSEGNKDTAFLTFLRTSNYAPLELALRVCRTASHPMYAELIYVLARLGSVAEAFALLLVDVEDAYQAIQFVETYDTNLWVDLVEYSLQHEMFLAKLLDYLDICNFNPINLLTRISSETNIPALKQRIGRILTQFSVQVFMNDKSNDILEENTLKLLKQLNQQQRKAVKVDPRTKCISCGRSLFLFTRGNSSLCDAGFSSGDGSELTLAQTLAKSTVWAPQERREMIDASLLFSSKNSFHAACYQKLKPQISSSTNL